MPDAVLQKHGVRTDGCLAVNIIGERDIISELTTLLSNENEMDDDSAAELFVLGKLIYLLFLFRPKFKIKYIIRPQTAIKISLILTFDVQKSVLNLLQTTTNVRENQDSV